MRGAEELLWDEFHPVYYFGVPRRMTVVDCFKNHLIGIDPGDPCIYEGMVRYRIELFSIERYGELIIYQAPQSLVLDALA